MKNGILMVFISVLLISCKKEPVPAPNGGTDTPVSYLDVTYGTDPAQKLDVYLPAGRNQATTKVIILIHGGAWSGGDKNDFNSYVDTLKKRLPGYAIFNINYRLAVGTSNLFPTQENDVKTALNYIYSNSANFKISEKWVLLGASAGGHLALLQAYKYTSPVAIKAVIDFFGPADLTDMYNNPASVLAPPAALAAVIGATPTSNPAIYLQSSPVTFVTSTVPPTMILQGGIDPLVSPNQSVMLKNKLTIAGVVNQYVFYPTESHGWTGASLTDSFDKIASFLVANVN